MANETDAFSASAAHFKATAEEKLARLRKCAQFHGFISEETLEAFARIEQSAYAGRSIKHRKAG
ncbi:hypothetical protein ACIPW4_04485 [Pseudomonas sp. NPDC089996]|uniref:hypothetical protein n=1 Tax=Pseudomonas sp. NPDC089996 TaxID=3364474 RepID=UPI0038133BE6